MKNVLLEFLKQIQYFSYFSVSFIKTKAANEEDEKNF